MTNKPTKRLILRRLSVDEISGVTEPAQAPARVALFKAAKGDSAVVVAAAAFVDATEAIRVAKSDDEGAMSFDEARQKEIDRRKAWAIRDVMWPLQDALSESLCSIVRDAATNASAKVALIDESLKQFSAAVAEALPAAETAAAIAKALPDVLAARIAKQETGDMTGKTNPGAGDKKPATIEELQKALEAMTAERDTATAAAEAAIADLAKAQELAKSAGAAAEETITIGGKPVKKSAMDPALFEALKAEREQTETERLLKMADTDLAFLPGKAEEKMPVLKAISGMADAKAKTDAFELLRKANRALETAVGEVGSDFMGSAELAEASDVDAAYDTALNKFAEANGITSEAIAVYKFNQTPEGRALFADVMNSHKTSASDDEAE